MGYFDALAGGSFKQIDGRWVFYPWGVVGRGYVIPTEQRYVEIRSWVKRWLQLWLPLVVVMGILVGWLYSFALLPVFSLWYWSRVRRLAQELEPATQRLTVGESYRAQARGHSLPMLWLLELGSVAFVVAGGVIFALDPAHGLLGAVTVAFFGACAVAIGFMIRARLSGL